MYRFLYELNESLENKIRTIASKMYCAVGVDFPKKVIEKLEKYEKKVKDNITHDDEKTHNTNIDSVLYMCIGLLGPSCMYGENSPVSQWRSINQRHS